MSDASVPPPGGPPPAGPPPTGSPDDNLSANFRAFVAVMMTITVLSITLRFWSRSLLPRGRGEARFWWDDWTALAAVPFLLTQQGISLASVEYGMGRHTWTLPLNDLIKISEFFFAVYFLYDISLFLAKASALFFLSRIFPSHSLSKWFTYTLYATHAMNLAWLLGIVFGTIFMCNPVEKQYHPFVEGTCRPTRDLWIGSAVPSVAIDLIILLLPLPLLWKLQISFARKAGIMGIFVVGYAVVVISLGRMITSLLSGDALNNDITYEGLSVVYWVGCEGPIILLGICAPALLPLGRHLSTMYFEPLASKVSLVLRSRTSTSNSRSHGASQTPSSESINKPGTSRSKESDKHAVVTYSAGDVELGKIPDGKTGSGVSLSPYQQFHSTEVSGTGAGGRVPQVPRETIWVESDVRIDRQTQG